jgi:hypothetical protein
MSRPPLLDEDLVLDDGENLIVHDPWLNPFGAQFIEQLFPNLLQNGGGVCERVDLDSEAMEAEQQGGGRSTHKLLHQ